MPKPEAVEANGEAGPEIAFGPQGQLYLSYTQALGKHHTGNIRAIRWQDGGHSVQRDKDAALTAA